MLSLGNFMVRNLMVGFAVAHNFINGSTFWVGVGLEIFRNSLWSPGLFRDF